MVYVTVAMTAFTALVSLAVDLGHARVVKAQLQCAADAAARYAVTGLTTSVSSAQNNAVSAAAANKADGASISVDPNNDVDFGTWSNGTFTVLTGVSRSNANAVRIWARRTAATGNPVSLSFGGLIGKTTCDVTASGIASYTPGTPTGVIGLSSVSAHANLFIASYDSSVTTTPTTSSYDSKGVVQSNGAIDGGSGAVDNGSVTLGPGGSVTNLAVTGSTTNSSSAVASPTVTMNVVSNPGGVSQTPVIANGQTVNWPGGTYYFTSLTMNDSGTINFTGPVTIYINGPVSIHDFNFINAYNGRPGNLTIYMANGNSWFMHDSDSAQAQLIAPGCSFTIAHDHCNWYGSVMAASITAHDNDCFYCDETLRNSGATTMVQ